MSSRIEADDPRGNLRECLKVGISNQGKDDAPVLIEPLAFLEKRFSCVKTYRVSADRSARMLAQGDLDVDILRIREFGGQQTDGMLRIDPAWLTYRKKLLCRPTVECSVEGARRGVLMYFGSIQWMSQLATEYQRTLNLRSMTELGGAIGRPGLDYLLLDDFTLEGTDLAKQLSDWTSHTLDTIELHFWVSGKSLDKLEAIKSVSTQLRPDFNP